MTFKSSNGQPESSLQAVLVLAGESLDSRLPILIVKFHKAARVDAAQANMLKLKAGPQESTLQAMQAQVDSDKAALDAANVELARMELRAPFDGTIAELDVQPNEFVTAGTPIVQIADTAEWRIESRDVDGDAR